MYQQGDIIKNAKGILLLYFHLYVCLLLSIYIYTPYCIVLVKKSLFIDKPQSL